MKIFTGEQIREIDALTIKQEPISSIDLMERAVHQLFLWITERFVPEQHFIVFAGPGNNGGDGLALARLLAVKGHLVEVYYIKFTEKTSPDWKINHERLEKIATVNFVALENADQIHTLRKDDILIDSIFGTGLTHPVEGIAGEVIKIINHSDCRKISIDMPSGLFGEDNRKNSSENIVKADYTLSFQFPRLSFLFAENSMYTGEWHILPIGLDAGAISNMKTPYSMLDSSDVKPLIKKRNRFDHKGIFGHGLLISGSFGKMGAAVLGAHAALRTGIGLITCHIPFSGTSIIQSALPEAMVRADISEKYISDIGDTAMFTAVGIGPGMGTGAETQAAFHRFLSVYKKPLVIDADGLNILSSNKDLLTLLPADSVLTPHPKEFERLTGKTDSGYERLRKQVEFSRVFKCIVVLKGAHTSVTSPDGRVVFNNTGNPGMATGGSGDVLTGIILSFLAQGYLPYNAAVIGVYLHGLAGDIAAEEACYESIVASDIIKCIGKAFNRIRERQP